MIQNDLLIRNENVQRLYDWYNDGTFVVNRKYQRKLVWTFEEKQKFINSILLNYPVPLILLASTDDGKYEIIDGMQRLNAIFSFIKGEFPATVDSQEGYFDLQTMASSKSLMDNNKIVQNYPLLDRELCLKFVSYQLPFSITNFDDKQIEDIFRRINATGKQLSSQDLRQAGATHSFPELVRKISADIRRDSSPSDILLLSQMEQISLSSKSLPYGINIADTMWVKNGIITIGNMRVSRDEELIAQILLYILLGATTHPTAKNLDEVYGYSGDESSLLIQKTTTEIEKRTASKIRENFLATLDQLQKTIDASEKPFNKLLFGETGSKMTRSFQVVFLAVYNLLAERKKIKNYKNLANLLDGIGNRLLSDISSDNWSAARRQEFIKAIQGVIECEFVDCVGEDPAVDEWISKLENILIQSKIEQQLYDFKIGLHDLNANPTFNQRCFSKIIKTLTAMANTQKNSVGYVIVGVADSAADAKTFETIYGTEPRTFNNFYITGIQEEIKKKHKDTDSYYSKVKDLIKQEPISDSTKSSILRNMRLVDYYEKTLLVLKIESESTPIQYGNAFYERHGNSVVEISSAQDVLNLFARFN